MRRQKLQPHRNYGETLPPEPPELSTLTVSGPATVMAGGYCIFSVTTQSRPGTFIWNIVSGAEGTTTIALEDVDSGRLTVGSTQTLGSIITVRATYDDESLAYDDATIEVISPVGI